MKKFFVIFALCFFLALPVLAKGQGANSATATSEELKEQMQERRAAAKERWEAAREKLKIKLAAIKDEKKKAAVERINLGLEKLNDRLVTHYSLVLDKLEKVLVRIAVRADRAESKGLDVSTVRSAITDAQTAIAGSRDAIVVQAGKVYTIAISSEQNLRADVGKTRQALHNDLKAVRLTVKAAHEAVRGAATALAQISKGQEKNNSTNASTQENAGASQ